MTIQQRRLRPGAVALAALLAAATLTQASPAPAATPGSASSSSATPGHAPGHTSAANSAPSASAGTPTDPVSAALQRAAATGQPVTVDSLTGTGTLVQANPDGTLTRTVSSMPQRVQRNGTWVPIDTTLSLQHGALAPAATTTPVSFSPGGTTGMATLDSGSDKLDFSWPTALPAPVVAGNTATYPNVFPDVDLQLTADPSGYTSVLVLKSAAAAADPQLQNLSLGTSTVGVTLSSTADGGAQAVDTRTGQPVFTSDTALMWDSSSTSAQAPAPATKAASFAALGASAATPTAQRTAALAEHAASTRLGAHQAKIKVGIVKGRQTLGLDQALLHAKSTNYPVFVDPSWTGTNKTGGQLDWARISDNGWNVYNSTSSDPDNNAREGWDANYPQANGERARTYYQMDTSGIEHAVISAATLSIVQLSAASCSMTPAVVYGTAYPGGWNSSGLYWGHEPALQTGTLGTAPTSEEAGTCPVTTGTGSHVSPPDLAFNVLSRIQTAAADGWGSLTLMVESQNMNDPTQWKQFATGGGASLSVTYSFAPQMTNGTGDPTLTPSGTDFGQTVTWNNTPTLSATAFERAGDGEKLRMDYHVYNSAGTMVGYYLSPYSANGGPYKTATLADGTYTWQAIAENASNVWAANWTPTQKFTVDTTRPTPPAVSSVQFPARAQGAPAGTHGTFVLNNDRSTTINGYMFALDSDLSDTQYTANGPTALTSSTVIVAKTTYFAAADNAAGVAPGTNGTATLSIPVTTAGPHTLYVKEINTAGTASVETSYLFYAGTSTPTYVYGDQLVNGYSVPNTVNGITTTVSVPAATTTSTGGHLIVQNSSPGITWADGHQGMLANNTTTGGKVAKGDTATFSFDIPSTGYWDIGASLTQATDYGIYSLVLDSGTAAPVALTESGSPFDAYSPFVTTQYEDFGYAENNSNQPVTLNQGVHTLTLTLTGQDSASAGFQAGIDLLRLSPITTCTINSTANCLNNTAFSTYTPANGSTAAAVTTADADGLGDSFNTADLTASGWPTGGGSVTVDGAPITLAPTGGTWGDNMLASGQTVDMPTSTSTPPVGGTVDTGDALVFLAFSTGGPTTEATGSITYNGSCNSTSSQGYTIDTVPDWSAGSGTGATLTLAHRNQSNNTQTSTPLHIYALSVPVACPGVPIASIALPAVSFGVSGTNALHILGLGLRPTSSTWTSAGTSSHFTGTWEAADDTTWVSNTAGTANGSVSGQTLRIPARISIGNDANQQLRIHLSNALGKAPVTFNAASVALQDPTAGGANTTGSVVPLTFAGSSSLTLPAGSDALSDPVTLAASPQATLLVSLDINGTVSPMAGHGAAQNPVYITTTTDGTDHTGDASAADYTTADLGGIPYLSAIDVSTPDTVGALVLYGDQSINSDTATSDGVHHLSDQIADAMVAGSADNNQIGYGILNAGTNSWGAGNNLLPGGDATAPENVTGPVDRAVLEQADVRTVLISSGTSDLLACPSTLAAADCASQVETKLAQLAASIGGAYYNDDVENPDPNPIFNSQTGYITVYIATIPPSAAALSTSQEAARELVNTALLADTVSGTNCTSSSTFTAPGSMHEDGVVNLAAAVSADGSATDAGGATIKTADSYLSNKTYYPNDQYYTDLAAQYLSDSQNPCLTSLPN